MKTRIRLMLWGSRTLCVVALALLGASVARADYHRGDFNLDGVVDTNDYAVWYENRGRTSCVPNPDVVLTRSLRVSPDRKTVLPGETIHFTATGSTNQIIWAYVTNRSGAAALTNFTMNAADYQSGVNASNIDIVEAWTVDDWLGRSFVNVIGSNEVAQLGKAVIIAGGKDLNDPVWLAGDYLADTAFNTLRYRGYSKDNVQYLSRVPVQDVDGDGNTANDVDQETTFANARETMTNWVGSASKLFVYLVDHGEYSQGLGSFRLNPGELLSATQFDTWLDGIQTANTNAEVTVVLDFCYSGAFAGALTWTGTPKRTVIAACSTNELTYFLAGGVASFSAQFFGLILQGASVGSAFNGAQQGMSSYQTAILQDDGGAISNYLGASFVAGKDIPIIGTVLGIQSLAEGTAARLWAGDIVSYYPLQRVWCAIVPPRYTASTNSGIPVVNIPEVELTFNNASGRYEGTFEGFSEEGVYQLSYFAQDIWNSVSLPRASQVERAAFDERLILVVGGATNDPAWSNEVSIARNALITFHTRRFAETNRLFVLCADTNLDLNADGTNDITRFSSLSNLVLAITNWAAPAQRLTLYLTGLATNDELRLNETETLPGAQLGAWLNQMPTNTLAINVVMDFAGCGACVTNLVPPPGRERIVIAGTMAGYERMNEQGGQVSFSQYFLSEIFNGKTIGQAYKTAKTSIRRISGPVRQRAQINDNANAIPNEKDTDGDVAINRYIGAAFLTGADAPYIGSVIPATLLAGDDSAVIWAAHVVDLQGISNVWCVVTEPTYDGVSGLYQTNLAWSAASNRYEAVLYNLTNPGTYGLAFYASNALGEVSAVVQSELIAADAYEPDDVHTNASLYLGPAQQHTLHATGDVDWIRFYASTSFHYAIETVHLGTNIDTVLELYRELPNGDVTNITPPGYGDSEGKNEGEVLDLPLGHEEGFYYAKVSQVTSNGWAPGSYELFIYFPAGGGRMIIYGVNALTQGALPPGSVVSIDGSPIPLGGSMSVNSTFLSQWKTYSVGASAGAPGFGPNESPSQPGQVQNPYNTQYGNPQYRTVEADRSSFVFVQFAFTPQVSVTGLVKDLWTGEAVSNATLSFRARTGSIANYVYDRNPPGATYLAPWKTTGAGGFPTNVWLPAVDWDILLVKTNYYSNLTVVAGIRTNATAVGAVTNMGVLRMTPRDANGNAIADGWETLYLGGPGSATNDEDGDGQDNLAEYWSGTNPTDPASVFRASQIAGDAGFTLVWPTVPPRHYQVLATENLTAGVWTVVAGPWQSTGPTNMIWTDTTHATNRVYQIKVSTP